MRLGDDGILEILCVKDARLWRRLRIQNEIDEVLRVSENERGIV